ncbi:hypothetical protein [Desulfoscipio gibsoniae]|uniref:Uncharacterized protein n=1 Tax=Desulfoscipio gibsoniae DSM 7213 TaxID=767817 RepID=R4KKV3_9FIRM|nr:hypothetical protein [Desulfoscipio gibsoniae]AGL03289.1 hypothetical protein Desgi_4010 [Desulfoscipio gibsoniae DSM 7213]
MKQIKLYNVIFPAWFLLFFFPPIVIITLIGNLLIDSLVILVCFFIFKLGNILELDLKRFYKQSILKVWMFGFLADIIGASILFFISNTGLPHEVISAINYDPFSNPVAIIIMVFAMLVSSLFIFIFNYKFTWKKIIIEKQLRFKLAITIAIITTPWAFLLPTKWFY